jgi:hypothetical protein
MFSLYNGVPLIYSILISLANDDNYERFKEIVEYVMTFINRESIPIASQINLKISIFVDDKNNARHSCIPIIHIGELNTKSLEGYPRYQITQKLGLLNNYKMRDYLYFILNNISKIMEDMTDNHISWTEWNNSVPDLASKNIVRNITYLIENLDRMLINSMTLDNKSCTKSVII